MTEDQALDLTADWKRLRPRPGGAGNASYLLDRRFGRLLVLERAGSDKHGGSLWLCGCDCGQKKVVSRSHLVSGQVKSCGCLKTEYRKSPKTKVMAIARAMRGRNLRQPLTARSPAGFSELTIRAGDLPSNTGGTITLRPGNGDTSSTIVLQDGNGNERARI